MRRATHNPLRAATIALALLLLLPAAASAHGIVGDFDPNRPVIDYLWLGAKHMLLGWDHLLFIAGVVLFASTMRSAAKLVSVFVLGHSVTLMVATLAGWQIDPVLVDAIIALSLVYVGVQGIMGHPANLRLTGAVVFAFGLVHGLGLSTRLQDLGLPDDGLVWRILVFNVGIELGQLAALLVIVGIVTLVLRLLKQSLVARRIAFGALAIAGFVAALIIAWPSVDDGDTSTAAVKEQVCTARMAPPPQQVSDKHAERQFYGPDANVPLSALAHSIGHGYVAIRYRPDIDPDQLARLKRFATSTSEYAIVSPDPDLGQPIRVITARTTLTCAKIALAEVTDFHDRWLQSIGI